MNVKDMQTKIEINTILQNQSPDLNLKLYFENIQENKIRRAIHILSSIYPGRKIISNDDLIFISYVISNKKFLKQQSFCDFIRALNVIDFTESQKNILIGLIKIHFVELCEICTFELDEFLIKIFKPYDLFKFIETFETNGMAVSQRISDILRYENFSNTNVSDQALETLKAKYLID
jgi:hypothetical protein